MTVPARVGLTQRQRDCLTAIKTHINVHGVSPSIKEIAIAMNSKSRGRVHSILVALQERGWISFLPRKVRSIVVVPDSGPLYSLPPDVQRALRIYCVTHGEDPASVVADAVALHLDEAEEQRGAA